MKKQTHSDAERVTSGGDGFREDFEVWSSSRVDSEKRATISSIASSSRTSTSARILRSCSLHRCLDVWVLPLPRPSSDPVTGDVVDPRGLPPRSLPAADMISHAAPAPSTVPAPNRATLVTRDRVLISDDCI